MNIYPNKKYFLKTYYVATAVMEGLCSLSLLNVIHIIQQGREWVPV